MTTEEVELDAGALLPCPMCGADAFMDAKWAVCCNNSDCQTSTMAFETKAEALAAWNRRTLSASRRSGAVSTEQDYDPLRGAIYEVLRNHRLSNMVFDGTDDAYCLVDCVTAKGQPIADGEEQLRDLADELAYVVGGAPRISIESGGAEPAAWRCERPEKADGNGKWHYYDGPPNPSHLARNVQPLYAAPTVSESITVASGVREALTWTRDDLAEGLAQIDGVQLPTHSLNADWRNYRERADDLLAHLSLSSASPAKR